MGWERYFWPSWFNAADVNALEEKLAHQRRLFRERLHAESTRAEELEAGLGRVALLARSLAELCLKKGVITPDELRAQVIATGLEDASGDRRLDPTVVIPGETKLADLQPQAKRPSPRPKKPR
jgi:hypothetical protein